MAATTQADSQERQATRNGPMASPAPFAAALGRVAMHQIAGREGQDDVDQEGGIGRAAIEIDARE